MDITTSQNVIELALKLKDTDSIVTGLEGTEKKAFAVVKSLQSQFGKLKDTSTTLLKSSNEYFTSITENLFDQTKEALRGVASSLPQIMKAIRDKHPALMRTIDRFLLDPFKEGVEKTRKFFASITKNISSWVDSAALACMKLTEDAMSAVSSLTESVMTRVRSATEYLEREYPVVAAVLTTTWRTARAAALGFTTLLTSIPTVVFSSIRLLGDLSGKVVSVFKAVASSVKTGVKLFVDLYDVVKKNVTAAVEYIGRITGLGYVLGKIRNLGKIALTVTGITATAATLKAFFMNTRTGISGLLGPRSAMSVFMDHLNAALLPLSNALTQLAVKTAPILVRALTPLLTLLIHSTQNVSAFVDKMLHGGGGKFSGFMAEMQSIVSSIVRSVMDMGSALGSEIVPLVIELVKHWGMVLKQVVTTLLPVIKEFAAKILPVVGEIIRELTPVLLTLFKTLADVLGPLLISLVNVLLPILTQILEMLPKLMPALMELVKTVGVLLQELAPLIVIMAKMVTIVLTKLLTPAVVKVLEIIIISLTKIGELLTYGVRSAVTLLGGEFLETFSNIATSIEGFFGRLAGGIKATFTGVFSFLRESWDSLRKFFGFEDLDTEIHGIFGSLIAAVQVPIDIIKRVINDMIIDTLNLIMTYDLPVIGSLTDVIGVSPIPHLARGGIVQSPILAQIGEGGPEAVLPLRREILREVVPELVTLTPNVILPDKLTTRHGEKTVNLLLKIEEVLHEIKKATLQSARRPSEMRTESEITFTLEGFVK